MRNPAAQGRRDANHGELAEHYEAMFCSVLDLSHVGFGCPDLAVACSGRMELVEVKTADGELNAAQKRFASVWRGPKIVIARTRDDVEAHIKAMRKRTVDNLMERHP